MTSEHIRTMNTAHAQTVASEYVGALLEGEDRVLMVAIDPDEPWEAFRAMRKQMRRRRGAKAAIGMFHSDSPLGHSADVIPLQAKAQHPAPGQLCQPDTGMCEFRELALDQDQDGFKGPRPGFAPSSRT